jgi:hypothetical protein
LTPPRIPTTGGDDRTSFLLVACSSALVDIIIKEDLEGWRFVLRGGMLLFEDSCGVVVFRFSLFGLRAFTNVFF